jgi:LCP family protein required for cell wall assembly
VTRDTARSHDDPPYDRDLIRSGSVSQRGERRNRVRAPRTASRRGTRARGGRSFFRMLAVIVGGVLLGMRAAAFNATVSSAPFPSTQLLGPLNGSDRVNVLMVGYGGPGHDGAYLADSIQILSIDPKTNTTVTIPVPRDLWIEGIAALPQNGKVNEVFAQGYINGDDSLDSAGALMSDVLSTVTGLEIHHWLSIDFTGFRDMVDAVGGVTIDNPVAFSYTTNEEVGTAASARSVPALD